MDERISDLLKSKLSDQLYKHHLLKAGCSFRLFDRLPGSPDQDVCVKVENCAPEDSPEYQALSHTQDDNTDITCIQCNGVYLAVTLSLVDALRRFRLSSQPNTFWIDQCYIDQSNVAERSYQVSMMRRIYASAQVVCA
jgi:hypothetical protein